MKAEEEKHSKGWGKLEMDVIVGGTKIKKIKGWGGK